MLPLTRKHLAILLGFALTAWGLHGWTSARGLTLLRPYHNPKRAERVYAWLTRPSAEDVLVIGSSRVEGGIEARVLQQTLRDELGDETTVYELGIAGLRAPFLDELVRDGVARRPPRRLLVLALEPRFFCRVVPRTDAAGQRAAREAVPGEWSSEGRGNALTRSLAGLSAIWNLPWTQGRALRAEAAFRHANAGEPLTSEELAARHARIHADRRGADELFDLGPERIWQWPAPEGPELQAFARTLEALDALPCDVLFVRMPLTAGFDATYMPHVSRRFLEEIVPLVRQHGHEFLDLQGAPYPSDDGFFHGRTHLNLRGAEVTSRLLGSHVIAPRLRTN